MRTSLNGRLALAASEGVVNTAYKDSVGVWTLGIGHTIGAGQPDPKDYIGKELTIPQIMEIFERDLKLFEDGVSEAVRVPLMQYEFDALVHFAYNVGIGGFKRSKLLKNLNAGKKKEAFQTGFHGWLKPAELKSRRDKERKMAQTGDYGSFVTMLYTSNTSGKLLKKGTVDLRSEMSKTAPKETLLDVKPPAEPVKQEGFLSMVWGLIRYVLGWK